MQEPPQEFAELLARARRDDQVAMQRLVELYEPQLRVVARVRLGPALRPYLDSADLVQSVHRSLLLGLRQDRFEISGPEQLLALALTLVRRKVARHWRHLQRQKRLETGESGSGDLPQLLSSLSTPGDDPARATEFNDTVRHVCEHLEPIDRKLVEMRLEGFSTVEVARTLGLDAHLLRVRLSRLRERLRSSGVLTEWL